MKAVVFDQPGEPEAVLALREVEPRAAGAGEVLVRVDARPIHPADLMFIRGRYRVKPARPQVAGLEGGGVVVASGSPQIPVGARVAFRSPGAWAALAVVPVDRLWLVPPGIDPEAAAQFSLNPITAWGLLDELRTAPGDWIAINAASSGVAGLVRALASARGLLVVNIVRNAGKMPPGLPTVESDAPGLGDRVLSLTRGQPLAGLLDSIGGSAITSMLPALRPGATIVSYGVLGKDPATISNPEMVYRNLCWKGFGIDHWLATSAARILSMTEELWSAIRSGALALPVRARYPLEDFGRAVADASSADRGGKVLIRDP